MSLNAQRSTSSCASFTKTACYDRIGAYPFGFVLFLPMKQVNFETSRSVHGLEKKRISRGT